MVHVCFIICKSDRQVNRIWRVKGQQGDGSVGSGTGIGCALAFWLGWGMERGIFGVGVFEYACVLFQRYSESIISTGKPLTNNNIPRKSKPHFFSLFLVFLKQNTDVSEGSDIKIFLFVLKFGQGVDVQ